MSYKPVPVPERVLAEIDRLIEREGGYSNRQADRGGPTNMGITINTLSSWLGRRATIPEVKDLSRTVAHQIYYQLYWLNAKIDAIAAVNMDAALFMFDWVVNSGPVAIINIQAMLTVTPDGDFGPASVAAMRKEFEKIGTDRFMDRLISARTRFLIRICQKDPGQTANLLGWYNRVESFRPMRR